MTSYKMIIPKATPAAMRMITWVSGISMLKTLGLVSKASSSDGGVVMVIDECVDEELEEGRGRLKNVGLSRKR